MFFTLFLTTFLTTFNNVVLASKYILTPKSDDSHVQAQALGLQKLASFDDLTLYTSYHDDLLMHKNVLTQHFYIEEDSVFSIQQNVPWHLDRITKRNLPLNQSWPYAQPGSCHVNADVTIDTYIVDTGIDVNHPEFGGRAHWGANFVDNTDTDCNNHGTHVAGLVGSKSYGVCADSSLYAVKVLSCDGSGSLSGVIQGIEWAYKQHIEKSKSSGKVVKSVINMSLGGGFSNAINLAVENCLKNQHFYIVVAAGNENQSACKSSPASAKSVITVMASDSDDNRAWFSNWGPCADIFAPGVDIISTIPNDSTAKYSGTSMASPVMTGVLNHYIDMYPNLNQKQLLDVVKKTATKDVMKNLKGQTNNLLAFLHRGDSFS
jgi:subtilisin family serine protease